MHRTKAATNIMPIRATKLVATWPSPKAVVPSSADMSFKSFPSHRRKYRSNKDFSRSSASPARNAGVRGEFLVKTRLLGKKNQLYEGFGLIHLNTCGEKNVLNFGFFKEIIVFLHNSTVTALV